MEVDVARDLAVGSTVTNQVEITNDAGDADPSNNNFKLTSTVGSPYHIRVQETHNWVGGEVLPDAHVKIVLRASDGTTQKASVETDADGDGRFWAPINTADIVPGDRVEVTTEGTSLIVINVMQIDGTVHPDANSITGKVYNVSPPPPRWSARSGRRMGPASRA